MGSFLPPLHSDIDLLGWGAFLAGFMHPVLGLDHLLAMLSVGIVSAQIGGDAIWSVPLTFVGTMAVGGAVALTGLPLPWLEAGIALSVLLLGLCIAAERRVPFPIVIAGVVLFALFHGYAHGAEIPETARAIDYIQGFLLGTALIHVAGVGIGHFGQQLQGKNALLIVGILVALCGIYFLIS